MTQNSPDTPVSIIIPVYNEKDAVGSTVGLVRKVLKRLPEKSEAIFVNDHSSDESGELLAEIIGSLKEEPIRLVHHDRNRGYGASLKSGIVEARNNLIAITDADGTYPVHKLPNLLRLIHKGARMAVGQRPISHQPLIRRPAKIFLNSLASWLSTTDIPDINSGLRIFYRDDALRNSKFLPNAFSFTSTITMQLACEGEKISYMPINYGERIGSSKIRPIHDLYEFTMLIMRLSMAFNPLRIFMPVSMIFILSSFILLIARLLVQDTFGLATTIVLFVAGVQTLFTGLVADLINRRLQ